MVEINDSQSLINLIRKIVRQEINEINGITPYVATVETGGAVDANVTVRLAIDTSALLTLKNKTPYTLNAGNQVYVFALNNNLSNAYVAVRK